jgi:DUF971 family protein
MGILDDLKPQTKRPTPTDIGADRADLLISWSDGHRSRFPLRFLRERCPCAGCVDEWSGKRTLDPASIPGDIRPLTLDPVGRYALQIGWSDGHSSGIYSWDLLLKLEGELNASKEPSP